MCSCIPQRQQQWRAGDSIPAAPPNHTLGADPVLGEAATPDATTAEAATAGATTAGATPSDAKTADATTADATPPAAAANTCAPLGQPHPLVLMIITQAVVVFCLAYLLNYA